MAGLLSICVAFGFVASWQRTAMASTDFPQVGSMAPGRVDPLTAGDLGYSLVIDPRSELGLAEVSYSSQTPSIFREYNLRTLSAVRDFPGPVATQGLGPTRGSGTPQRPLAVVDSKRHRIIFAEAGAAHPAAGTCPGSFDDNFAVLDESTLAWTQLPIPCLPPGLVPFSGSGGAATGGTSPTSGDEGNIAGMAYDDVHDALYAVLMDQDDEAFGHWAEGAAAPGKGPVRHYVEQVDPTNGAVLWQALLPQCDSPADFDQTANSANNAAPVLVGRHGDLLDVMCTATDNQGELTSGQAAISVLERISLGSDGRPNAGIESTPLLGDPFGGIYDPSAGVAAVVSNLAGYDYGAYVVDGATALFRGFVATGNDTTFNGPDEPRATGLDQARGRLYMRTERGLIVTDIEHTPLPTGITLPELADNWQYSTEKSLPISVDDVHHRLYFYDRTQAKYLIYEDDIPSTPAPPHVDPDSGTQGVSEANGVTGVTFSGSGDAFGARLLSEGGPNRVANSVINQCPPGALPQTTGQNASLDQLLIEVQECQADVALTPGDRDWRFGVVPEVAVSTVGVAAQGSAVDIEDSATAKDFNRIGVYGTNVSTANSIPITPVAVATALPGPASSPSPSAGQSPYTTFPADRPQDRPRCFDAGEKPTGDSEQNGLGAAVVRCDQSTTTAAATAVSGPGGPTVTDAEATPSPSAVDVGDYWSQVVSYRDPVKGLVTKAIADARNVSVPVPGAPPILIREIVSSAEATAHGRRGTATGAFERKIFGFVSVGQPGTPSDYRCSDDPKDNEQACQADRVAAAITADLQSAGLTAEASVPSPDPRGVHGTPGGYQAVVTKDAGLEANDATANDDTTDTVDGLQIVFIEDGHAGKAREVVQLAGVHVEAHYGTFLLDATGTDLGATSPVSGAPDAGPLEQVGSNMAATSGGGNPAPQLNPTANPIVAIAHHIADVFQEGWRLLVSDPKTAALLAGVWGLLGMPVYLAIRRRSLVSKIARGVA